MTILKNMLYIFLVFSGNSIFSISGALTENSVNISCISLLLLASFSVFAFDFGGILSTTSYVQDSVSNLSFNQYVESSLWMRENFGKNTTLTSDIFYSFNGDFANKTELQAGKESTFINKLDLSSLKLTTKFNLENDNVLIEKSKNAKEFSKKFNIDKIIEKWIEIFKEMDEINNKEIK